jgi:hypothetical protein
VFSFLIPVAQTYARIDALTETGVAIPSTAIEAFSLIGYFDVRGRDFKEVESWTELFHRVNRQTKFAPDFSLWDKNARLLEVLAENALSESQIVIDITNTPPRRLPEIIETGIYTRVDTLKRWFRDHLRPIRESQEYQSWMKKKESERGAEAQMGQRTPQDRLLSWAGCMVVSISLSL